MYSDMGISYNTPIVFPYLQRPFCLLYHLLSIYQIFRIFWHLFFTKKVLLSQVVPLLLIALQYENHCVRYRMKLEVTVAHNCLLAKCSLSNHKKTAKTSMKQGEIQELSFKMFKRLLKA